MKHSAAALAFVLALAAQAWAQGKGGGFGREYGESRIHWYSVKDVQGGSVTLSEFERRVMRFRNMEPVEKKYALVYVRPVSEGRDNEPNEFRSQEMVQHSSKEWAFVMVDYDKENPQLKAWGVKGAPAILGCDLFLNDFQRAGVVSTDQLRRVIAATPELIARYQADLQRDFRKATETLATDEARAVPLLVKIVQTGKSGYKEVSEAQARLTELAEGALRRGEVAESVTPDLGVEYYEELAKGMKGTAPGLQAEIRACRLEHERGNARKAIERLQALQKSDPRLFKNEVDAAARALEDISRAGEAKLEVALSGDKAAAREAVRKLAADYAGTDAGRRASEALKRLE
jgi:hypothetical protein